MRKYNSVQGEDNMTTDVSYELKVEGNLRYASVYKLGD